MFNTHLLAITIEQVHVQLVNTFVSGVHTSFINQLKLVLSAKNALSLIRWADEKAEREVKIPTLSSGTYEHIFL